MPENRAGPRLLLCLRQFVTGAEQVWQAYQQHGPNRVDPALFDGVEQASEQLKTELAHQQSTAALPSELAETSELLAAVEKLCDLSHRCARRIEGLCFITGEAGLIPRKDLLAAYQKNLDLLNKQCQILAQEVSDQ